MKKSKFLTFLLSGVPGLGHYYLGLMNRGLQMMLLFFGTIAVMVFLNFNNFFPFLIPVIWFYSLFDALQLHKRVTEEQELIDAPLISWEKLKIRKAWIGWGLIFIGGYQIIEEFFFTMFDYRFYQTIRSSLAAMALIIIGLYLLSGKSLFGRANKKEVE